MMFGINPYQQNQGYFNQGYSNYQQMINNTLQGQQNAQNLIRVNGIDGAKAYQNLGANSTVALFDANDDLFYIKATDGAGFPTIRTFRFAEVNNSEKPNNSEFVTRQEFEQLKGMIINGKHTIQEPVTCAGTTDKSTADSDD